MKQWGGGGQKQKTPSKSTNKEQRRNVKQTVRIQRNDGTQRPHACSDPTETEGSKQASMQEVGEINKTQVKPIRVEQAITKEGREETGHGEQRKDKTNVTNTIKKKKWDMQTTNSPV